MSSNNNQSGQGINNQGSQQGSKSPSQESSKPASGMPERAGNQQKGQGLDAGMEKDRNAQNKQGGLNQGKVGQANSEGDDQESENSENTGNTNARKGTGTR